MRTNLLTKLMMLTTSSNDPEALAALRAANTIMKKQNVSWEEFLSEKKNLIVEGYIEQPKEKRTYEPDPEEDELAEMLSAVKANLEANESSAIDFILSLEKQYLQRGSLSTKQINALKKFYKNIR